MHGICLHDMSLVDPCSVGGLPQQVELAAMVESLKPRVIVARGKFQGGWWVVKSSLRWTPRAVEHSSEGLFPKPHFALPRFSSAKAGRTMAAPCVECSRRQRCTVRWGEAGSERFLWLQKARKYRYRRGKRGGPEAWGWRKPRGDEWQPHGETRRKKRKKNDSIDEDQRQRTIATERRKRCWLMKQWRLPRAETLFSFLPFFSLAAG